MRIGMVAYTNYMTDARVRRYAETLAKRGDQVEVIALAKEDRHHHETINNVDFYVIQARKQIEKDKLRYFFRILVFFIKSSIFLTYRHLRNPYQVIHVHNLPDILIFTAFFPKLFGAKLILDIHDILPEFYSLKFNKAQNGLTFKFLKFIEKISCAFSNHVFVSNHIWQRTLVSRSVKKEKCSVILNYPDESIFFKRPRKRTDSKFIMIYPGSWIWLQGIDIAIKALSIINNQTPALELHLYGGGDEQNTLESLVADLGLKDKVFFKKGVPVNEMADIIANSDLGIAPTRDYGFANEALSTKIMEFMALGIPAIASDTKVHRYYFNDKVLKFFKAGDENSLANAMLQLIIDSELRKRQVSNANEFIQEYLWKNKKKSYLKLIESFKVSSIKK